jgi:chromosomal replication initiator protein
MICICPNCKEVFETIPQSSETKETRYKKALTIIELCKDHFSVTRSGVLGKRRNIDVVAVRHAAMYLIRKYCRYSYLAIGNMFNRDHSTAIHADNRVKNAIFTQQDLYEDIIKLEAAIDQLYTQPAPTTNYQLQTEKP